MNGSAAQQAVTAPRPTDPDSRARTHLANERTFLAWLRTGLSLIAVGLAAAGFLPVDLVPGIRYVTLLAILLIVCGTIMVAYGANRYARAYRQIESGTFQPATSAVIAISTMVTVLGIMAIPVVVFLR